MAPRRSRAQLPSSQDRSRRTISYPTSPTRTPSKAPHSMAAPFSSQRHTAALERSSIVVSGTNCANASACSGLDKDWFPARCVPSTDVRDLQPQAQHARLGLRAKRTGACRPFAASFAKLEVKRDACRWHSRLPRHMDGEFGTSRSYGQHAVAEVGASSWKKASK